MIRTWAANIEALENEVCYRQYYRAVPKFRQEKADRLRTAEGKAQSIGAWTLYEQMKQFYKTDERAAYNFSHSGKYVLCSVCVNQANVDGGSFRVGCDVEQVGEARLKVAKRFFCASEYRSIVNARGEAEQKELFYRFWVLKESLMKATGRGLALGMDSFEIRLGNPSELIKNPEAFPEPFYYMETELGEGTYRAAVCSTDACIDSEVKEIKLGLSYNENK